MLVDRATADSRKRRAQVQHRQRVGRCIDSPSDGNHDAAKGGHDLGSAVCAETVNDEALDGSKPGLKCNEQRERELN
jgi:hypothetical protein